MTVRFDSPLYATDVFVPATFVEVLNALVGATDPAQMHRLLLRLCARQGFRNPDNYFVWGFDGPRFWMQQRLEYRSEACFDGRLLTVVFYTSPRNRLILTN